jgi:hypothetical protein
MGVCFPMIKRSLEVQCRRYENNSVYTVCKSAVHPGSDSAAPRSVSCSFFHERLRQTAVQYEQAIGMRISGVEASHVFSAFFGGEKGGGAIHPFPASPSLLLYILVWWGRLRGGLLGVILVLILFF